MPDVCVTLVLYNSRDHLTECAAALKDEVDAGRAEVVAVDNASPDDSAAVLAAALPQAKIVRAPENLGFAGGCNLVWDEVRTRYWLLLNPDVVLDPGTLGALVRWMDDHAEVGIASPWLRDPDGDPEYPGRAVPSIWLTLLEMTRLHKLLPVRLRGALLQGPYVLERGKRAPPPGWLPATAVIVRSRAVHDAGALDASFFLYGEDLEWSWRLRRCGWRLAAAPVGGGVHHASASSKRTWQEALVQERIATGTLRAIALVRGSLYARLFAMATVAATAIESWHPARSGGQQERAGAVARAWRKAMRSL